LELFAFSILTACFLAIAGRYVSINASTREQYLKYITGMDVIPEPEVFGMHDNADITSAQEEINRMFGTVLALLPRSTESGHRSREQAIAEIGSSILRRLPQPWEIENVAKKYPTTYAESMNTVLVQEAIRYNRLIVTMRQSLRDLAKALKVCWLQIDWQRLCENMRNSVS
jgi:dynein heavy chain, axonemal